MGGAYKFHDPFHSAFYEGAGSSTDNLVPFIADCAIGGRAFMIDWEAETPLRPQSVPILRQQSDDSRQPGEQSVNPEGFWRRTGEGWHFGAGQEQYDRFDGNPFRFRDSKGIDVWTKKWAFSLLPATDQKRTSVNTNLKLVVAGSFLYLIDGTEIRRTADITVGTPTFTNITGVPGTAPTDIATDGFNIITCHGAANIYKTTRGAAAVGGAAHITGAATITGLAFVKSRFIAFGGPSFFDITALTVGAGGALPGAFFTHGNTDFVWVGFAEGDKAIYGAGFSGDKSLIYRVGVTTQGTALDAPIVAGRLPEGEIVNSIYGYLGKFIAIGTNKGFRLALEVESGDLNIGELIETPQTVMCFEGQGPFIWYGLTGFDGDTGLGRMSLKYLSDPDFFVPAYASDLMVDGVTSAVRSVVTFQNIRVFAVSASGVWAEDTNLVAEGHIDTGEISYNLPEFKIGVTIDASHTGEFGEHEIQVSVDGGPFVTLGTHHNDHPKTLGAPEAKHFEFRHILRRYSLDTTVGLTINSWLLEAQPRAHSSTTFWYVTLLIAPEVEARNDQTLVYDTWDVYDFLSGLSRDKEVTTWQIGERLYSVVVDDFDFPIEELYDREAGYYIGTNGSFMVKLKETK